MFLTSRPFQTRTATPRRVSLLTRMLICPALLAASCYAQFGPPPIAYVQERPKSHTSKLWVISCATLLAATSLDMASSWGHYEQNSFLKSSDGRFGGKGVSLKLLMAGATLGPQFMFRNKQGAQKIFTIANFVQTGLYTGVAARNFHVTASGK